MTFYSFSGALFFNYWVDLLSGTAVIHLTCWQFDRCHKNKESSSSALTRGLNVIKEAAEKGWDGEQTVKLPPGHRHGCCLNFHSQPENHLCGGQAWTWGYNFHIRFYIWLPFLFVIEFLSHVSKTINHSELWVLFGPLVWWSGSFIWPRKWQNWQSQAINPRQSFHKYFLYSYDQLN